VALKIVEGCINCGNCRHVCPTNTIRYYDTPDLQHTIEPAGCIDCNVCIDACPVEVIFVDNEYVHDPAELTEAKALAAEVIKKRGPQLQQVLKVMRQRNTRWAREREDRRDDPERYQSGNRIS